MLEYDFEESVGYWLCVATQAYVSVFNEEVTPHGVTFRQSQVLGLLVRNGEMTQSELAARMMIEPPTLVGVLDRMERAGWVTRHDCPTDRRKKIVRVDERAEPVWAKIVECARGVRSRATEGMSERQVATLKKLLRRVLKNTESRAGARQVVEAFRASPSPSRDRVRVGDARRAIENSVND